MMLDMKYGIFLLSLKHHLLLSYLQSIVLLSARRATGDSLTERISANSPFSTVDQEARSSDIVEGVFFHAVMAYPSRFILSDPLAFRLNAQNLIDNEQHSDKDRDTRSNVEDLDGVYRHPKLAPTPYTEAAADRHTSCLHVEGTSDLGSMPSLPSNRAREIQRIEDSEEENFTRLVMKKDACRRRKGEEDFRMHEEEVLGDEYEELRQRGKIAVALSRLQMTWNGNLEGADDGGP
ncbi:hypothetical protein BD769DRAFT_1694904 [Suillus cothurnatus]|nr:hypothetical protein BD769DRAFT_1694904 [Suillus cothurnatus]